MNLERNENLTTADFVAGAGRRQDTIEEPEELRTSGGTALAREESPAALFVEDETRGFRERWTNIQAGFVDEPQKAVEQADTLVANVMKRLAEIFAEERRQLEGNWGRGKDVSTEDLRQTLRRYRSFFDRLLSV
jgi:hypothetical protein